MEFRFKLEFYGQENLYPLNELPLPLLDLLNFLKNYAF